VVEGKKRAHVGRIHESGRERGDETVGRSNGGSATKANCEPRRKREQAHITSEHIANQFALPARGE